MIILKVVSISWSKLMPYLMTSGCILISSGHSFVIKASNTHFKEEILDKLWTNLYGIWYMQCVVWDYLGLWKKVERNSSLKRCMSPLVKPAKKILRSKVMLFSKNMYASETMKSLPSWQLPWLDIIFEGSCHQKLWKVEFSRWNHSLQCAGQDNFPSISTVLLLLLHVWDESIHPRTKCIILWDIWWLAKTWYRTESKTPFK